MRALLILLCLLLLAVTYATATQCDNYGASACNGVCVMGMCGCAPSTTPSVFWGDLGVKQCDPATVPDYEFPATGMVCDAILSTRLFWYSDLNTSCSSTCYGGTYTGTPVRCVDYSDVNEALPESYCSHIPKPEPHGPRACNTVFRCDPLPPPLPECTPEQDPYADPPECDPPDAITYEWFVSSAYACDTGYGPRYRQQTARCVARHVRAYNMPYSVADELCPDAYPVPNKVLCSDAVPTSIVPTGARFDACYIPSFDVENAPVYASPCAAKGPPGKYWDSYPPGAHKQMCGPSLTADGEYPLLKNLAVMFYGRVRPFDVDEPYVNMQPLGGYYQPSPAGYETQSRTYNMVVLRSNPLFINEDVSDYCAVEWMLSQDPADNAAYRITILEQVSLPPNYCWTGSTPMLFDVLPQGGTQHPMNYALYHAWSGTATVVQSCVGAYVFGYNDLPTCGCAEGTYGIGSEDQQCPGSCATCEANGWGICTPGLAGRCDCRYGGVHTADYSSCEWDGHTVSSTGNGAVSSTGHSSSALISSTGYSSTAPEQVSSTGHSSSALISSTGYSSTAPEQVSSTGHSSSAPEPVSSTGHSSSALISSTGYSSTAPEQVSSTGGSSSALISSTAPEQVSSTGHSSSALISSTAPEHVSSTGHSSSAGAVSSSADSSSAPHASSSASDSSTGGYSSSSGYSSSASDSSTGVGDSSTGAEDWTASFSTWTASSSSSGPAGGTIEYVWTPPINHTSSSEEEEEDVQDVVISFELDYDSIVDMEAFILAVLAELARLTNTDASQFHVNSVRSGSTIVNATITLTAAEVLQQFADVGMGTLNPNEYPIFAQAFKIDIPVRTPDTPVPGIFYETMYDTTCNNNIDCIGMEAMGICTNGLCGCAPFVPADLIRWNATINATYTEPSNVTVPALLCSRESLPFYLQPDMTCFSGSRLPGLQQFADVCVHALTTRDHIEYAHNTVIPVELPPVFQTTIISPAYTAIEIRCTGNVCPEYQINHPAIVRNVTFHAYNGTTLLSAVADECTRRDPRYVNIFPRRRFCQHRDYSDNADRLAFVGILGNPFGYSNRSTLGFNATNVQAYQRYLNMSLLRTVTLSMPYSLTELLTLHRRSEVIGIVSTYAYVSNLYNNKNPIYSKAWAHLQFRYLYSNTSVQITSLTFVDGIEGDRNYYFRDNKWNYLDGVPSQAYAFVENGSPRWECQLWHAYDSQTNACVPGCSNGLVGTECSTPISQEAGCASNIVFNNRTAFISYNCQTVVCLEGSSTYNNVCEASLLTTPIVIDDDDDKPSSSSSSFTTGDILTILAAGVAVIVGVALLAVRVLRPQWLQRFSCCSATTPSRISPAIKGRLQQLKLKAAAATKTSAPSVAVHIDDKTPLVATRGRSLRFD